MEKFFMVAILVLMMTWSAKIHTQEMIYYDKKDICNFLDSVSSCTKDEVITNWEAFKNNRDARDKMELTVKNNIVMVKYRDETICKMLHHNEK